MIGRPRSNAIKPYLFPFSNFCSLKTFPYVSVTILFSVFRYKRTFIRSIIPAGSISTGSNCQGNLGKLVLNKRTIWNKREEGGELWPIWEFRLKKEQTSKLMRSFDSSNSLFGNKNYYCLLGFYVDIVISVSTNFDYYIISN